MISSKWKGEKAGYEMPRDCEICLSGPWKVIENGKPAFK